MNIPSTVGSMTIVTPDTKRVVVVFLATLDSRVVTVGDVLGPYVPRCARREWVTELRNGALKGERFQRGAKPTQWQYRTSGQSGGKSALSTDVAGN
jgi:hypothetical protein